MNVFYLLHCVYKSNLLHWQESKSYKIESNSIEQQKSLEIRIAPNVFSIGEKMTDEGKNRNGGIRMSIGFVWP